MEVALGILYLQCLFAIELKQFPVVKAASVVDNLTVEHFATDLTGTSQGMPENIEVLECSQV